jgi:hypothetical protein
MSWSSSAQSHLAGRGGVMPRWLLWVAAREIGTLSEAPVGLWTGEDDLTFTIGGEERVYNGALSRFDIEPVVYGTGLDVRTMQVTLAANAPETEDMVRGRLIRLAPVELHLALFDPATVTLIDVEPMFRGFVNRAPLSTPAQGGGDSVTIEIVSRLRVLALPGPVLRKTDEAHRRLNPGDGFRRYGTTAGEIRTEWVRKT